MATPFDSGATTASARSAPVSEPQIEIEALCEVHQGSGHLVLRREGDRIVLDGHADHCCVLAIREKAAGLLFDVLGEWLG